MDIKILLILILLSYFASSIGFWVYIFTKQEKGLKLGFSFFGIAFLLQILYIGYSDYKIKSFALASEENLPLLLALIIGGIFYGFSLKYKKQLKDFGSIFAPINVFLTALVLPNTEKFETPTNNIWFILHILFSMMAYAFIVASTAVAIIYILTERNLKKKKLNSFFVSKFSSSLATLQDIEYKSNALAFIFLSLALIASSVWSSVYLGKHWVWDSKQVALSVLWVIYGFLLHIRIVNNYKGKKFSYLTVLASIFALIAFWVIKHPTY
ncbi:MAG TPA: cytochrome C biogenesis protein [Persephonella sp.]|nr:cytochrome C biogenesis protein [Hydrogenothermaceae bacterium]HIQ25023.1 cytochrome C biogenesis protein [Persephonella sp.]